MNIISGNDVSNNTEHGMWISLSNNNTISGNTANETIHSISLDSSDGNIVFGNIVSLNNVSGLYMCKGSDNNTVFNNYLNNDLNANIQNYNNTWNTTKTEGKNIIGGPYIAGNFWAKPDGSGFSENAKDSDLDGIADTKYEGTNFTDYLPSCIDVHTRTRFFLLQTSVPIQQKVMLLWTFSSMTVRKMQPSGSGTLEMETVQLTRMQHILIQQQEAMKLTLQ
jgi:parallel beta-helix repeat protein